MIGPPPPPQKRPLPDDYELPPTKPWLKYEKFVFSLKDDDRIAWLTWLASDSGRFLMQDMGEFAKWLKIMWSTPVPEQPT